MTHVLQVRLTTTRESDADEPGLDGEILYALRLNTDGMEEGQQYVEAINQGLYESQEVWRWKIDARYQEQHEVDHSIVDSFQQIIATTDMAIAIPIIRMVAAGIAPLLSRYRFGSIDSDEAIRRAREFLEDRRVMNWAPTEYEVLEVSQEPENHRERFHHRERLTFTISVQKTINAAKYNVRVGGSGKLVEVVLASRE